MNNSKYQLYNCIQKCKCKCNIHNLCFLNHIYYNFCNNKYNIECYFCKKNIIEFNGLKKNKKYIFHTLNIIKCILLFIFNLIFIYNFTKLIDLTIDS